MTEESCLHCDINDLVRERIEAAGDAPVNLPELIAKVGESLVDLIMLGPEEQWGNLLAEAMRQIGDSFLEKNGAGAKRHGALTRCRCSRCRLAVARGDVLNQLDNAAADFWILDPHEMLRE